MNGSDKMEKRLIQFARSGREDGGVALVAVIGLSMVMLLLVATALSFSASGLVKARTDQDWNAALSAAYAGVDEYASRLSNDSTYVKYGNPAANFTRDNSSSTTVTMPLAENANPAFDIRATDGWAVVAGSDGRASFRYEVDNSLYSRRGDIRIRSTGLVGKETRSVVATLRQDGFLKFLYHTEYELMDPQVTGVACDVSQAPHAAGCQEVVFGDADSLTGPIHSSDTIRACGTHFNGDVTSSNSPLYVLTCGTAIDWGTGRTGPTWSSPLGMPATNGSMANETRVDLPTDVPRPGCMYTGPTTITFAADGMMRVISPWTKFTRPSFTAGKPSENPNADCGALVDLRSPTGAVVPVPDQNLIFVQNVPTAVTDPNYTNLATPPANFSCTGTGPSSGWTYGSSPVAVQYPITNEVIPPSSTAAAPAYKCTNGDVFVKGKVRGAVTVAAENNVYVTGDLTYVDAGIDVLGLVGQNAVWVWNPMKSCTGTLNMMSSPVRHRTCTAMPPVDTDDSSTRTIQAAILSVGHTFQVQNFDTGAARGTLNILGTITQKFRGSVAWQTAAGSPTGYTKVYVYDDRLMTTAPPKFLTPTSTTYGVTQYVDASAGFKADGSPLP